MKTNVHWAGEQRTDQSRPQLSFFVLTVGADDANKDVATLALNLAGLPDSQSPGWELSKPEWGKSVDSISFGSTGKERST